MKYLVLILVVLSCSISFAQSPKEPNKGPSDNASIKAKIKVLGQPLLYTLVFMPTDSAETLGDAGETPDAIVRRCKGHIQSFHNVTTLTSIQLTQWRARLGCSSDCVLSKGTASGLVRRVENGVPETLNFGQSTAISAILRATSDDCDDINDQFDDGACDPKTQTYDVRLSGFRLITRFDSAVSLFARPPPLDLPPPPP